MRVRAVLLVAVSLVVVYLGRGIAGDAPAVAGSNRVPPAAFAAILPPGGQLCQPAAPLPQDAAAAVITIGTYGRPVPAAHLRFVSATGGVSAEGQTMAGGPEGPISIALRRPRGAPPASGFCLRFAGRTRVVVAGVGAPPGPSTAQVNGSPAGEVVSVIYHRSRAERWSSLLGTVDRRLGRGKAALGDWTLPACALALLAVWAFSIRLLGRELR